MCGVGGAARGEGRVGGCVRSVGGGEGCIGCLFDAFFCAPLPPVVCVCESVREREREGEREREREKERERERGRVRGREGERRRMCAMQRKCTIACARALSPYSALNARERSMWWLRSVGLIK